MNGPTFPSFLRDGAPPAGLMEHWAEVFPNHPLPRFVSKVTEEDTIYAYLPVEQIKNHVNDPTTHYHMAGKVRTQFKLSNFCCSTRRLTLLLVTGRYSSHDAKDDETLARHAGFTPMRSQDNTLYGI